MPNIKARFSFSQLYDGPEWSILLICSDFSCRFAEQTVAYFAKKGSHGYLSHNRNSITTQINLRYNFF